jgi:hypothetical protein
MKLLQALLVIGVGAAFAFEAQKSEMESTASSVKPGRALRMVSNTVRFK